MRIATRLCGSITEGKHMTFEQFIQKIKTSRFEHFGAVFFDVTGKRVGFTSATSGEQDRVTIKVSNVLEAAKAANAASIVLMHSHPKDFRPNPSKADIAVTTEIALRAMEQIGVPVVDHIIYGAGNSQFSFAQNGIEI